MIYPILFIFGAIVGSFLNVCIYRMPREESVVKPASRCPSCKKPIQWFDNIPLISFALLGARCRCCKARISIRYFLVELLTGVLFAANFMYFGLSPEFFIYTALLCALLVGTFTDFSHYIIPDEITLGGLVIGLVLSFIYPQLHSVLIHWKGLLYSLWGAAVGASMIYATGFIGELIFKKEAMGGGDVKLMAMIGAVVGWKLVLLVFFVAPFFGAFVGIYLKFVKKIDIIPYGPYLSLATVIAIFYGDKILRRLLCYAI